MHLLSIVLLAVCTNIDNAVIAISIGVSGKRLPISGNIIIAFMSAASTFVFSKIASFCCDFGRMANIAGSILIIILGVASVLGDSTNSQQSDIDQFENYTLRRVLALAVALAVNCLPVAFGAGLTGMSPWFCAAGVGIFSAIGMRIGNYTGLKLSRRLKTNFLKYISGIAMIILGVIEFFI